MNYENDVRFILSIFMQRDLLLSVFPKVFHRFLGALLESVVLVSYAQKRSRLIECVGKFQNGRPIARSRSLSRLPSTSTTRAAAVYTRSQPWVGAVAVSIFARKRASVRSPSNRASLSATASTTSAAALKTVSVSGIARFPPSKDTGCDGFGASLAGASSGLSYDRFCAYKTMRDA